jgi:hypothetical protein
MGPAAAAASVAPDAPGQPPSSPRPVPRPQLLTNLRPCPALQPAVAAAAATQVRGRCWTLQCTETQLGQLPPVPCWSLDCLHIQLLPALDMQPATVATAPKPPAALTPKPPAARAAAAHVSSPAQQPLSWPLAAGAHAAGSPAVAGLALAHLAPGLLADAAAWSASGVCQLTFAALPLLAQPAPGTTAPQPSTALTPQPPATRAAQPTTP